MNPSKGLYYKTVAAGNISFDLRRTNILKETIHWDQYFMMISPTPSLIGISNAEKCRAAIEVARQRARIRKYSLEESASLSKVSNPGKLKWHKDWITWSRALKNYLLTIIGQDGVPLSYVIRDSAAPDYAIESQPGYNFGQLSINCVPLIGLTYKKYAKKSHQPIHGFVQDETAETWINPKERKQDGQLDYLSLLAHYGGKCNKAVRIKEAEALQTSLIHKNERSMSFEEFLTKMQAMLTGLYENGDILNEFQNPPYIPEGLEPYSDPNQSITPVIL